MWSYRVQNPIAHITWAGLLFLLSFLAFGSAIGDEDVAGLIFATVIATAFFAFAIGCLRIVRWVDITPEGMVVFVRILGATRVPVHTIQRLEGCSANEYGKRRWYLRVHYQVRRAQHIDLREFPEARAFARRIERLNPSVRFLGEWPVLPP